MGETVYTFNQPSKEIVEEYYAFDESPAEAMQKFLNENSNYRVKHISTTGKRNDIYVLVVYELEEEND